MLTLEVHIDTSQVNPTSILKRVAVSQTSLRRMMLKHDSQYGWSSLWKNEGSSKGFSQPWKLKIKKNQQAFIPPEHHRRKKTHSTNKTLPTPFSPKRLNSLHTISNTPLAFLAFWQSQSHMTCFTVRMSSVHGESHIVVLEDAITSEIQLSRAIRTTTTGRRCKEWISAFSAKEVLFMIRPFP